MDPTLIAVAAEQGGYVFRHQLLDLGFTDKSIAAATWAEELVRVRHGTYVPSTLWWSADSAQRHAIVTRSVLDKLGPDVVASHVSAAVLHGLDVFGVDLRVVHLTRLAGENGRREAGVIHHQNHLDPDVDVVEVDGRLITSQRRSVLETCTDLDVEAAMVTTSSALRGGVVAEKELEEAVARLRHWPGVSRARLAVRLSDARLETVGEVRSLHMMWTHRVPHPQLQVSLRRDGTLIGRGDFGWLECCHVGEFDGMIKYGRLNPHRADPGRVIEAEKVREDEIRALGLGMSRWTWADLAADARRGTVERIMRAMEQSHRLYARGRTSSAL